MKLIIDIPEEVKHKVYAYGLSLCPSDKEQLINAIMNGIPQQPCDDTIYRQAVLDTIAELNAISFYEAQEDSKECYYEIKQAIKSMPPASPKEPKTGQWILTMPRGTEEWCYKCSRCGFWKYKKTIDLSKFNYCPSCGAKMVERQEGDELNVM